jgi:hypothetical protein
MKTNEEIVKDLTLMPLYLTSWEEKPAKPAPNQSGEAGKVMIGRRDALVAEELMSGTYKAKSVWFTDEGCNRAQELLKEYKLD